MSSNSNNTLLLRCAELHGVCCGFFSSSLLERQHGMELLHRDITRHSEPIRTLWHGMGWRGLWSQISGRPAVERNLPSTAYR